MKGEVSMRLRCNKCGRVIESITMPGIAQTEDNELSLNRYKRVKHFLDSLIYVSEALFQNNSINAGSGN